MSDSEKSSRRIESQIDSFAQTPIHDKGLFQIVLSCLPMPYLLVDTQERVLQTNQACLDMLKIDGPVESCYGKSLSEVFYNDPSHPTVVGRSIQENKIFRDIEVPTRDHHGTELHIVANVFPLYDLNKDCIGGMCIYVDTTERKRTEEALERRMVALTRPLEDTEGIQFEDMFNLADIQRLQDEFANATRVASIITRPDGTPITNPSNFCRLCSDIIRKTEKGQANCFRSDAMLGQLSVSGPTIRPCMSGGLWDAGAGISVGGRHIANWLIGQVRDASQNENQMRDYAKRIGADEDEVVEAFREVPSMTPERFRQIAQVLFTLTKQLSSMAYQNIQQARFISDRKQAEKAFKLSEERFKKLFDNVDSVAVQGYDRDRKVIYWNNASEKIYGYKKTEAIGVHLEDLIIPPDMRPHVIEAIRQYAEEGKAIPAGELNLIRKDGTSVPVYSSHVMQTTGHGDLELFCLDIDLTELDAVKQELISAKDKAEASNKAKSEFLANMSHEIRTPLNGILGMLQLLEKTEPSDEQKEYLLGAIKSSKRLTRLLSDILDLSKIEAKQTIIDEVEFDIEEMTQSICDVFLLSIKEHGLILNVALDKKIPRRLVGDETRLRQILFNIVGNAIKFTPEGSISVEISLLPCPVEQSCRIFISVSDTGIGIPDDRQKDILEPFTQVDGSYVRSKQGAGLGLAIVKRLVGLLGGSLCIDSDLGTGTTFYVALQFKVATTTSTVNGYFNPMTENGIPPGLNILVVEDEQINRIVACKTLNKLGCKTTMAIDGRNGLEKLAEFDFDLILMDIQMPVMDGVAATKAIRSAPEFVSKSNIPIIAMTAHAMLGDRETFLEAGMNDYVAKPFSKQELVDAIIRVTSKKS